jgi:hypothetical protein|tara:strand:- start:262 stop:603 length:342 start_codon:yes stop_codon:yes gene_type:complete
MKVFNKKEFVEYVRGNEYLYLDNVSVGGENDNFDNDMEIVNSVFDEDGIYGIEYGSRGEVEFVKVNNFVKDIIEFVKVSNKENEFRWIVENDDYLDLNFEEELSLSYFIIREV